MTVNEGNRILNSVNLYEVLKVKDFCKDVLSMKKEYQFLIKKYHPDKCSLLDANDITLKIYEARKILIDDPTKRKEYDRTIKLNGLFQPIDLTSDDEMDVNISSSSSGVNSGSSTPPNEEQNLNEDIVSECQSFDNSTSVNENDESFSPSTSGVSTSSSSTSTEENNLEKDNVSAYDESSNDDDDDEDFDYDQDLLMAHQRSNIYLICLFV
ncbi:UNVERIFIED_CONTAM: hypothetical protein RMT77_005828 [Armadillidium vulgare]